MSRGFHGTAKKKYIPPTKPKEIVIVSIIPAVPTPAPEEKGLKFGGDDYNHLFPGALAQSS